MIEVKVTASPLTNWAWTGNREGAIYGFEQSMDSSGRSAVVRQRSPL